MSGVIGGAPGVIVGQPNFVKKVVFPLEILPAAMAGALGYDLLIGLGLCLIGIASLGPGLTLSACWIPVIVAPVFFHCLGLGVVFFRPRRFYPRHRSTRRIPRVRLIICQWRFLFRGQGP